MPTASYVKFDKFVEHLAENVHDLDTHQLRFALTNSAPTASTNTVLADITEISYTNLASNPTSRNLTLASSAQSGGVYTLDFTDQTLTASGGSVGPFRYLVVYNDTPTSPADPLICYFDYGASGVTLADGETLDIAFNASGLFTIT
jgi:hypothetical protein